MKTQLFNQGLSGCKLELISSKVIRKITSNSSYNDRLLLQIKKQKEFEKFKFQLISTPEVYSVNYGQLVFFDMEYIPDSGFYDFFKNSSPFKLNQFIESIVEYFDQIFLEADFQDSREVILEKLLSLRKESKYKSFIDRLIKITNSQSMEIPITYCHGDLTLSNILFASEKFYFIDFLDSYIESVLIDIAKLKQDLYHFWNLDINSINEPRLKISFNHIWNYLESRYSNWIDNPVFDIIEATNLLRIEPYLMSEEKSCILDSILKGLKIYE